ncbi:undecaprenyldiphospho-muramoylpentapeptide beta-N-acetylglucosaminyltransferase [Arachnia propionica]|uniref:UDP-N-acetylglucosamine--N-acetylmuramyl-(pentapeptide) pyrophosphoryl-undecaprenol N-acetylglucosamine transferase n=1 Tax=Arachnia propionica TaxID=1750 RepID=A0A3P1T7Z3_9ACTN|nr:undecaprenyldiphospho-muramoylpentapeptide beta-N-acetylglucosaminyltransferase [Arachnia propionica]RRD04946.1 undecaprenyldiphospho-muramoylpentapeptide beta-N-acetylglucosaminyltransferase [Arachnia propionica]
MTRVVLAGGGTAGHTSPLIATAQALQDLDPQVEITCIGTAKGLETKVIPRAGLSLELIRPVPLPRTLNLDLVKLPWNLVQSVREARAILRRARAEVLVGFGGYVSIPAYLAARTMRVPVCVHEANRVVGVANKVAARFARFTGYTFPETRIRGGVRIGMPINRSITSPAISRQEARQRFGLDVERPTLLVSGGSQGARAINEAVMAAVPDLLGKGIQVLHVLGGKNFTERDVVITDPSGARYVPVAYVDDMVEAYMAADLMVGRAGAGTVMETAVLGLPVVFVPLPWGNGEQARNAAGLVADGAGIMLPEAELGAARLVEVVVPVITDPKELTRMGELARPHSPADAADVLARKALLAASREEEK